MANGLVITKRANGLRANGLAVFRVLKKAANGLLATGAVSWVVSLF